MQQEKQYHGIQISVTLLTPRVHGLRVAAMLTIPLMQARFTSPAVMWPVTLLYPPAWPCCQLPTRQTYVCLVVARRSLAP